MQASTEPDFPNFLHALSLLISSNFEPGPKWPQQAPDPLEARPQRCPQHHLWAPPGSATLTHLAPCSALCGKSETATAEWTEMRNKGLTEAEARAEAAAAPSSRLRGCAAHPAAPAPASAARHG